MQVDARGEMAGLTRRCSGKRSGRQSCMRKRNRLQLPQSGTVTQLQAGVGSHAYIGSDGIE